MARLKRAYKGCFETQGPPHGGPADHELLMLYCSRNMGALLEGVVPEDSLEACSSRMRKMIVDALMVDAWCLICGSWHFMAQGLWLGWLCAALSGPGAEIGLKA